jgi:hypothetical protein
MQRKRNAPTTSGLLEPGIGAVARYDEAMKLLGMLGRPDSDGEATQPSVVDPVVDPGVVDDVIVMLAIIVMSDVAVVLDLTAAGEAIPMNSRTLLASTRMIRFTRSSLQGKIGVEGNR